MKNFAQQALKALKEHEKMLNSMPQGYRRVEARRMLAKVYPKSLLPAKKIDIDAQEYTIKVLKKEWPKDVDIFVDEQPPRVVVMKWGLLIGYVEIPKGRTGPLIWHDRDGEEFPLSEFTKKENRPVKLTPAQKSVYNLLVEHGPIGLHDLTRLYFPTAIKKNGQPYVQSLDATRKVLWNLSKLKAAESKATGWMAINPLPDAKKQTEPKPMVMSAAEKRADNRAELITLIQEMEQRACQCDAINGFACDCHGTINKMLRLVDDISK